MHNGLRWQHFGHTPVGEAGYPSRGYRTAEAAGSVLALATKILGIK
jgi:hypothetical protein